jgi:hypothetical protein
MKNKAFKFRKLTPLGILWIFLFLAPQAWCESAIPFEKESVFCMYFELSKEEVRLQDIEELLISQGRPAYSNYKPAEMFTRKSVKDKKADIEKKLQSYSQDTLLKWTLVYPSSILRSSVPIRSLKKRVPVVTPFIQPQLTARSWALLQREIKRRLKTSDLNHTQNIQIDIYLRAQKTEIHQRERVIARQRIYFPIRYIVFAPEKVDITANQG